MFLGLSLRPCRLPAFALATSLAGGVANVVLATGVSVVSFKYFTGVIAAVITALFAGPRGSFPPTSKGTSSGLRYVTIGRYRSNCDGSSKSGSDNPRRPTC